MTARPTIKALHGARFEVENHAGTGTTLRVDGVSWDPAVVAAFLAKRKGMLPVEVRTDDAASVQFWQAEYGVPDDVLRIIEDPSSGHARANGNGAGLEVDEILFEPGPGPDPAADPDEATAKALLDALRPVTDAEGAGRFLDPEAARAASIVQGADPAYFYGLKRELKPFSILRDWQRAIKLAGGGEADEDKEPSQRDALLMIGSQDELWRDGAGETFVSIKVDDHTEHHRLSSKSYSRYLIHAYGDEHQITTEDGDDIPLAPGRTALTEALDALDALAARGPTLEASVRVGHHEDKTYLDLADETWRAVEIDADGWRMVDNPPVQFIRPNGVLPLPVPVQLGMGEGLRHLRRLLRLEGEASELIIAWMLGPFMKSGPFPILVLGGQADSSKSTTQKIAKRTVDPNQADARSLPETETDLQIAARNSLVLSFDNLSSLRPDMADALCRLATGGGLGTRKLWTDTDEVITNAARPMILNGIPDIANRGDLIDRAVAVRLTARSDQGRMTEKKIWTEFYETLPGALGGLLDAVSTAIRRRPEIDLPASPRMVDFCHWVEAAAPALGWKPGEFTEMYTVNHTEAAGITLENDSLAQAVRHWCESHKRPAIKRAAEWGEVLKIHATSKAEWQSKGWPKTAQYVAERLRRLGPALKRAGICTVEDVQRAANQRGIMITPLKGSKAL